MQLLDRQIKWAVQYDGYGRLAGDHKSHEALGRLIDPAREEWRRAGRVPDWCGVDFLRGWAYFMVRVGRPALEPTGPEGPEFVAVLNAAASHPQATPAEVPPLRLADPVVYSATDRTDALKALCGDNDPWNRHLATAWRACAEPGLGDYPHRPRPDDDGEWSTFEARIAFFAPLLHLLMYGIGWSQPALGLARWIEHGRATDEPVLAVVDRWWGHDVDAFVAWLAGAPHACAHLRETLSGLPSPDEGRTTSELTAYDHLRDTHEWLAVWGGGSDPMHLSGHVYAPLADTHGAARVTGVTTDGTTTPRAVMVTPTYVGWYAGLRAYPAPTRLEGHDLRVDVFCPTLGWLGQYRRSAATGLWFRGKHETHMLGN